MRTASTSMRIALRPYCEEPRAARWYTGPRPEHPAITDVISRHPDLLSYFKFTFVREPFDRLASLYFWHKCLDPRRKFAHGPVMSYLKRLLAEEPWQFSQYGLLVHNGRPIMDFVGRYESLESDWARVVARLGIDAPLPHIHRSGGRDPATALWTPEARAFIREHAAGDFERFGY